MDPDCIGDPACAAPGVEICSNSVDDDGDGLIDCADPDCVGDPACVIGAEVCDDFMDNDGDGKVDCYDNNCMFTAFCTGSAPGEICTDHVNDNDGDWQISCADRDCAARSCGSGCICTSYGTQRETNCTDGVDNNSNGLIDCLDPDCDRDVACKSEDCSNGVDDNGNGLIDCLDPDCDYLPSCGGEDCYNDFDDDGDGSPDCQDNDCRHLPHCAVWTISCSGLAAGANCPTGKGTCLSGKCSEADSLARQICVPNVGSSCYNSYPWP